MSSKQLQSEMTHLHIALNSWLAVQERPGHVPVQEAGRCPCSAVLRTQWGRVRVGSQCGCHTTLWKACCSVPFDAVARRLSKSEGTVSDPAGRGGPRVGWGGFLTCGVLWCAGSRALAAQRLLCCAGGGARLLLDGSAVKSGPVPGITSLHGPSTE